MKKILAAILFTLLLGVFATAEIKLEPKDRVANNPAGYCGWCSLEMLGRYHKLEALKGIVEKKTAENPLSGAIDFPQLSNYLTSLDIPHERHARGRDKAGYSVYKRHATEGWDEVKYFLTEKEAKGHKDVLSTEKKWSDLRIDEVNLADSSWLGKFLSNGLPVAIGYSGTGHVNGEWGWAHAVVLVGMSRKKDEALIVDPNDISHVQKRTFSWLLYYWDGAALVITK